jgi:hypothetical protein
MDGVRYRQAVTLNWRSRVPAKPLITLLSAGVQPFEGGQRNCHKPRMPRCAGRDAGKLMRGAGYRLGSQQKGEQDERIASWAIVALVVLNGDIVPSVSAKAEPLALNGTLRKIKETSAITLAHREFSVPFSYCDESLQPVGYARLPGSS